MTQSTSILIFQHLTSYVRIPIFSKKWPYGGMSKPMNKKSISDEQLYPATQQALDP